MNKDKRKALASRQPFLQPDAFVVISIGRSPQDNILSVKSRYGWLTVGLLKKLRLELAMSVITKCLRVGCTITESSEIDFELHPHPNKLATEDQLYAEYTHNLLQGKPTDDDIDIANELKEQQKKNKDG